MTHAQTFIDYFSKHMDDLLEVLKHLVELESPSHESKEASDKTSAYLQDLFRGIGFRVRTIPQETCGDHVVAEYGEGEDGILFVGHFDTVFPLGTIRKMPFHVDKDKAYGPGILDMKGGLVMGYYTMKCLLELGMMPHRHITFFMNGDEESGSFCSSDLIIEEARKNKAVIVLEPGLDPAGSYKTQRYGRGTYTVTAHGKAAHSGTNPDKAVSPLLEIARQLQRIDSWNEYEKGLTFAPTCMGGGIPGTCCVPETAWFTMDVRFRTREMAEETDHRIRGLEPLKEGLRIEVAGGIDKPPMKTPDSLLPIMEDLGREVGLDMEPCSVGGGSDGNFTSGAANIPTLDGLGMTGLYLHNPAEYINLEPIPRRCALLARLTETL